MPFRARCIDARPDLETGQPSGLTIGQVYTVECVLRLLVLNGEIIGYQLAGVRPPFGSIGYHAWRFEPPTEGEVAKLRKMLKPVAKRAPQYT
jgi:hypothetical protein